MEFCHVTLSVEDLDASVRFYREIVGLEIIRRFPAGPDRDIVFLGSGGTEVELISGAANNGQDVGKGISLGFSAASLEGTIALLREKGYETEGSIVSPNPNTSFFFARDPDGYTVQFVKTENS